MRGKRHEDTESMPPPITNHMPPAVSPDLSRQLSARLAGGLAGHLGIRMIEVRVGYFCAEMLLMPHHLAANGYLHAGSVVTLADTACGFGCFAALPAGANNFTTIELKSNFLRTTTSGTLRAEARLVHGGRRTQVWDATVSEVAGPDAAENGAEAEARALALFRCTQMILYPQPNPE
jgi:uncharacterized protein (TIGR00369 family)